MKNNHSKNSGWAAFRAWVNNGVEHWDKIALEYEPDPPAKPYREPHAGGIRSHERFLYRLTAVLGTIIMVAMLLGTVVMLPTHGTENTPDQNEVSQRYIEQGLEETGATNLVSGMILDYRAFDTFGESCVLFLAATAVFMLLQNDHKNVTRRLAQERREDHNILQLEDLFILRSAMKILFPFITMFGIYVILNGHLSPGGGFSGGLILGAGLILYAISCGQQQVHSFFDIKVYLRVNFICLTVYACAKAYSFFTGANHLESHIPKGIPGAILSGGLILPLNICVGCVVACTMYAFYALFNRGEL